MSTGLCQEALKRKLSGSVLSFSVLWGLNNLTKKCDDKGEQRDGVTKREVRQSGDLIFERRDYVEEEKPKGRK